MPGLSLRKLKQAVEEERDACIKSGKSWAGVCNDPTQASLEEEKDKVGCSCFQYNKITQRDGAQEVHGTSLEARIC